MKIQGVLNIFLSTQMVGTFFIKASTYEFMKFHDLGSADTYFYSFEHYGGPSLWNFLFPGGIPGDPIPRFILTRLILDQYCKHFPISEE